MTTNIQLENYVKIHKLKNQAFLGVFPSDELPIINTFNACLIINYSSDNESGTHWVAMSGLNTRLPNYFDSYGLHPDEADSILGLQTGFNEYLKKHSLTGQYDYNTFDLQSWKQSIDDDVCGEYCLAFLYHGLPNINSPFWKAYLTEKNAEKRDIMIKHRIAIRK